MVFDNPNRTDETIIFNLTSSEEFRVHGASFIQKDEILNQISKWTFQGKAGNLLRLKNIVHVDGKFLKQEVAYFIPDGINRLVSDLMELSLSYAILWVDTNIMGFNEIAVAKTAHNTTNIDADVVEALIRKLSNVESE